MNYAASFFQACKEQQAEFEQKYSPDQIVGAICARVVMLKEDIQFIKDNRKQEYTQNAARKAKGGIIGLCQELVEEMTYWAEHEAHTEDAREEICCTIKYLLKKIEVVELIEAIPDDGSDLAYEFQRDRAMGVA